MKTGQSSSLTDFGQIGGAGDACAHDDDDEMASGLRRRPDCNVIRASSFDDDADPTIVDKHRPAASSAAVIIAEDIPTLRASSASVTSFPYSAGKYLVSEPIAAGGMASVHLGACNDVFEDGSTEVKVVALKRLHPHLTSDEYFTKMLLDEANISSSVRHDNVVASYGADHINGDLFLVMEYVPGVPLNVILRNLYPGAVPPRYAAAIIAGVLRGLHAAHEAVDPVTGRSLDIVHRDVSPQNVLIGIDGVPRVFDFGIAKATRRIQTTRTGEMKGKLAYMAPEQLLSDKVDRRTDVRAAAVVLWEALTGCPLFHAESEGRVINQVLDGHTPRPSEVAPDPLDIPPQLDAIVMRGLEKLPENRWSTALEMAEALESLYAMSFPSSRELGAWVSSIDVGALLEHQRMHADLRQRSAPPPPLLPLPPPVCAPPISQSTTGVKTKSHRRPSSSSRRQPELDTKKRPTTFELCVLLVLMFLAAVGGALIARNLPSTVAATTATPAQ